MIRSIFISLFFISIHSLHLISQDTFSMVAVDTITGEVGSAGASCVDLFNFPGFSDHFIGELFPGIGAINTQAWYLQSNQINARNRMNMGETPTQIIDWLIGNDINDQPQLRQYGITAIINGSPQSAAFTGTATDDYKNHIIGTNYAIQGNILLNQDVLDAMEANFLLADGDLACKLMAAMQGAKRVGADTRCTFNSSSSLFAYVKVSQPDDSFGSPSFVQSVRTKAGDEIEPIDSLQTLFNQAASCTVSDIKIISPWPSFISIYPNPTPGQVWIENQGSNIYRVEVIDIKGHILFHSSLTDRLEINLVDFPPSYYFIRLTDGEAAYVKKIIKS